MKKKIFALLICILLFGLAACGESAGSESTEPASIETTAPETVAPETVTPETTALETTEADYATKENPADPTEQHTIDGIWGTFTFKLDDAYVGDAATTKLEEMGENTDDFATIEEDNRLVILEYTVSADEGFDEIPFSAGDVISNYVWKPDLESKYEYYIHSLYQKSELDYSQLTLKTGEESTMYIVYELPIEADAFVESIDGEDREYWFLYKLTE